MNHMNQNGNEVENTFDGQPQWKLSARQNLEHQK